MVREVCPKNENTIGDKGHCTHVTSDNIENGVRTVSQICCWCGKTESFAVPMHGPLMPKEG